MSKAESDKLWKEHSAFFQANTVKGGRYLDDAGKIINDYGDAYWDVTVGLNGLRFGRPKKQEMPDEVVVDMNRVWMACYGDGCIKKTSDVAESITKVVCRHIGVDLYSRLGFRVNYYKPVEAVVQYSQRLYSLIAGPELKTVVGSADNVVEMISRVRFLNAPLCTWLGIQAVKVSRPVEKPSDLVDDGVIIDIDVFEDKDSSTRPLNMKHMGTFLRESSNRVVAKASETIALLEGVEKSARPS